jgi:hypothetical protein
MKLEFVSFNADTLSGYTVEFKAVAGNALSTPKLNPKFLSRIGNYPKLISVSGKMRTVPIQVRPTAESSPRTQRDAIAEVFDASDYTGSLKTLIAQDADNSNKQWKLDGVVIKFEWMDDIKQANVVLAAPDPVWTSVTQTTDIWNITASGQTNAITPDGNAAVRPVIEIKPTGTRTGASTQYQRFVKITNPLGRRQRGAINIANAEASNGLDTDALVTAGKLQADGDDLQVFVNGHRRNRWLQDPNTTSTEIWNRYNLRRGITATLGTAIAGAGDITTIDFEDTPANRQALERMPHRGQVLINSEYFKYRGKTIRTGTNTAKLRLNNVKRDAFGSSQAAHSVADTITWIQNRIWLRYGDTGAVNQNSADADDLQPVMRHDSENDRHDFDNFTTEEGSRANEWEGHIKFRRPIGATSTGAPNETTLYTGSAETNSDVPAWADPGTFLGFSLRPVQEGGEYLRTRAALWWEYYHPAGIDSVTLTGRIWATDRANYWPRLQLLYSQNGIDWQIKATIAAPTANSTWENQLTTTAQALSTNPRHIALVMRGIMPAGTTETRALAEFSDVLVSLVTANVPTVAIGAEQTSQYEFRNAILKNDTTGESIAINDLVIGINETLVIDCETNEAYLKEDETNLRTYIDFDTIRSRWIYMQGATTWSYTDSGTGNVTVTMKFYDRNN